MNISFLDTPYLGGKYNPQILSNRPFKKGELWERKTCKTCACYDLVLHGCQHCKERFGFFRIKPKHKACRYYKPKND